VQRGLGYLLARIALARGQTPPAQAKAEDPVKGWQFVEQAYRRIAHIAQGQHLPVILIIYPTPDHLDGRGRDDLSEKLQKLGTQLGWQVIDVAEIFDSHALYLPSTHPSPEGRRRMALYLAKELGRRHLLP
jgi:hypothetical protein